ncbi:polysaccharide deacetylase family protein [Streptosporangiaceae bacterium NEAU-GS5]|nr:polysaccharide deacetylase family protein [Streptosporangiaceae bacterium NEAU-GS5]
MRRLTPVIALAALAGCAHQAPQAAPPDPQAQKALAVKATAAKAAVARAAHANELGQIPVIMYHRVIAHPATSDDQTPKQFREELERMAAEKYVPITAAEYVSGKIGVPAGTHPVVLTFDDSSPSQVTLDATGNPEKDTAVGILLDVARAHPGFRPVATFYVTRDMFGKFTPEEQTQVLTWLHDNGFDLGNHTRDHIDLRKQDRKAVVEQLTAGNHLITGHGLAAPSTLALPYGNLPATKSWARSGDGYKFSGVFLAGYDPAESPFGTRFNALEIPRIRSGPKTGECKQFCSAAWLDWLNKHAGQRFTSDGDPTTVAFPKFDRAFLAKTWATKALPY